MGQLLGPGALAVQDVPKALDQDVPRSQHVGQLPHLLGVGDGLVEGIRKIVAAQNRQIGVVAFQLLIAVAVDHGQIVVVVLLTDEAPGVLTEGADLVLEGPGVAHQLGLVEHPVHRLHDLVAHLHPDADVHGARLVGDAVLGAEALQPVRPPPAGGDDYVAGGDLPAVMAVGNDHAPAETALQEKVGALVAKEKFNPLLQKVLLDGVVDVLGLFSPQVADGAVHQLQTRLDGPAADLLHLLVVAQTLHVGVGAVAEVDLVGVADGLLDLVRPH